MARLIPNKVTVENGLTINEKIIPWGAVWTKSYGNFAAGTKYKADRYMTGGTGKILGITIHNTEGVADAETYTRATYPNQNMGSARVHYYVDDKEAWQNLLDNEVGWHSGMGNYSTGNESYIAIEIIMNGSAISDNNKARSNGALLCAILMKRHGLTISDVVTHSHWNSAKKCPLYLIDDWGGFLKEVEEKYAMITEQDNIEALVSAPDNTPDAYAAKAVSKATSKGIIKGDESGNLMLHSAVSRQDLMVILERLGVI